MRCEGSRLRRWGIGGSITATIMVDDWGGELGSWKVGKLGGFVCTSKCTSKPGSQWRGRVPGRGDRWIDYGDPSPLCELRRGKR